MEHSSSNKPPKVAFFIQSALALSSLDEWIYSDDEETDKNVLRLIRELWLVQLNAIAQKCGFNMEAFYPSIKSQKTSQIPSIASSESISLLATDFDAREVSQIGASSTPYQPRRNSKIPPPISPIRTFPTLSAPNGSSEEESENLHKCPLPSLSATMPLTDSALMACQSTVTSISHAREVIAGEEIRNDENVGSDALEEFNQIKAFKTLANEIEKQGGIVSLEFEGGEAQSLKQPLYDPLPTISTIMPLADVSLTMRKNYSVDQTKENCVEKQEPFFPSCSSTREDESVVIISPSKINVDTNVRTSKVGRGRLDVKTGSRKSKPTFFITLQSPPIRRRCLESTHGLTIRIPSHLVEETKHLHVRASNDTSSPTNEFLDHTINSESVILTQEEVNVRRRGKKKIAKRRKIHTHDASDSDYEPLLGKV